MPVRDKREYKDAGSCERLRAAERDVEVTHDLEVV